MKTLLVEDNSIIQFHIKDLLRSIGITEIQSAKSGEQAIEKFESFEPDLVLMDIGLKGELSGVDTALKLREIRKDYKLIYMSGNTDMITDVSSLESDPEAFIIKPIVERELVEVINSVRVKVTQ